MIKTQDARCYHMQTQSELDLRESQLAQRESHERSFPSIQLGERHLPRLTDKCHESRVILITYSESLRAHDSNEPFPDDMQVVTIFSRWSFGPQMMILITYLDSSLKIKSDEYILIDM
jgi:hypothetical protein